MQESFAPGVMVDGVRVEPEGWMWVLGFALRGCTWAIEMADSPEFDMRGKIRDYERRRRRYFTEREAERVEAEIERLEARLAALKAELL